MTNRHRRSTGLLDIFALFKAEWDTGLEFGSLWQEWVENMATAIEELRNRPEERNAGAEPNCREEL